MASLGSIGPIPVYSYVGYYGDFYDADPEGGPGLTAGVLVERVYATEQAGGVLTPTPEGGEGIEINGDVYPVVCSELIEIDTEDGPATGRCGTPVKLGKPTCEGHAWLVEMSDLEWQAYERSLG